MIYYYDKNLKNMKIIYSSCIYVRLRQKIIMENEFKSY